MGETEGRRCTIWGIEHIRGTAAPFVALTGLLGVALGGLVWVHAAENDWLDGMMRAVVAEQAKEGPVWGTFAPYVAQLEIMRGRVLNNDTAAVYAAMNQLMDMLEQRGNGIPPEVADWLFDYCYLMTPAKYHDVSRHVENFRRHQFE